MKFTELTQGQKDAISTRYQAGELLREIAPAFDVSDRTIGDWLRRLGIQARRHAPSETEIEQMAKRYQAGESAYSLAKDFSYCQWTIAKYIQQSGVRMRNKIDTLRKYHVNASFFDVIDSESKAYWLGFIFADGYCREDLVIQLAKKDGQHLQRFLKDLDSNHPLKPTPRDQIRLYISNSYLSKALRRFPITPKSTLKYPDIPIELDRHFIRGYMDGDGGFYSYPCIQAMFSITTNNPTFLSQIQRILVANCAATDRPPRPTSHNSYELRWSRFEEVKRIFDYLYSDATVWLPRKRERMESVFD